MFIKTRQYTKKENRDPTKESNQRIPAGSCAEGPREPSAAMGPESEGVLFGFGFYFKGDAMF
jgi:hypothetical protein